jgi:hypothetical protein
MWVWCKKSLRLKQTGPIDQVSRFFIPELKLRVNMHDFVVKGMSWGRKREKKKKKKKVHMMNAYPLIK